MLAATGVATEVTAAGVVTVPLIRASERATAADALTIGVAKVRKLVMVLVLILGQVMGRWVSPADAASTAWPVPNGANGGSRPIWALSLALRQFFGANEW
jgi:hypothetical protein